MLGTVAGEDAVRRASSVSARLQLAALSSSRPAPWTAADAALALRFAIAGPTRRYLAQPGGNPARIACVGRKAPFRRLLEAVGPAELVAVEPRRSLWNPAALGRIDADLIAVEIHPWAAPSFRRQDWLIVPHTVRWRAPTDAVPPEHPSESLKSDLRAIAERGYSVEVCRDAEAWREFLCRMLVPYTHARYGSSAVYPSRSLVRRFARHGELLFVGEGGARLAGGCTFTSGTTFFFPLCGVMDGDQALVRQGALAALYHFVVERARLTGARTLDAGRTGPFLRNGVARYKLKWGLAPERDPLARLVAIRLDPQHEGLRAAFAAQPVLVDDGERLAAFPAQP